ncbi:MAG: GNAT family N-acetyltransferase [Phycisphaerales bacterium JB059]
MPPLAPIEIARLEDHRQARAVAEIAREAQRIMGGWMCRSEPGSWTNQAAAIGLDAPVSPAELDRLTDFYSSAAIEPRVELCPFADDSLVTQLSARGFTLRQFENVLYIPLRDDASLSRLPTRLPDAVTIERVDRHDDEHVETFIRASSLGFFPDDADIPDHFLDSMRRVARHPRTESFLARLDGRPVAGGGVEVADIDGTLTSSLFGVSVLPHARRRGIQQALIAARLRHARERGALIACIGSKPGIPTERNAARLGFRMAYTKAVLALAGEGLTPSP